ncbi:M20/M25/M40 family metallo-hydrolase [Escherichia coli]
MGNVLCYIGHGPRLVAMDAHIDTVGIGNIKNWDFDPYEGMETDELIGGRGTSDQVGGMASMVYAGKIIKDLGLKMNIPCWLPVLCRKKTATVCAGSTLLNNPAFARNLWSVPTN